MKSVREKKHWFKRKSCYVSAPLDDLVDKDVQALLFPLNLMQNIVIYPKYRIKNNFIYPNSRPAKFVSLCFMILSIFIFSYRVYELHVSLPVRSFINIAYITSYFDVIFYSIGFVINYVGNVMRTKRNIMFVLKIQDVHRFLNNDIYFKRFTICNWTSAVVIFGSYVCIAAYIYSEFDISASILFYGFTIICFDLNIAYATRLIKLLQHKVDLWNIQAQRLQQMDQRDNETCCKRMFQAYVNIIECYEIYKKSFQYMVCLFTV